MRSLRVFIIMILILGFLSGISSAQTVTELRQDFKQSQAELHQINTDLEEYKELEDALNQKNKRITDQLQNLIKTISDSTKQVDQITVEIATLESELHVLVTGLEADNIRHSQQDLKLVEAMNTAHALRGNNTFLDYLIFSEAQVYAQTADDYQKKKLEYEQVKSQIQKLIESQKKVVDYSVTARNQQREIEMEINSISMELHQVRQQVSNEQRKFYRQQIKVEQQAHQLRTKAGFTEFEWPLAEEGILTSDYGNRLHPVFNEQRFHTGVDLAVDSGTIIQAASDGIVTLSGTLGGYGLTVIIDHGEGLSTLYGHSSQLLVKEDQQVRRGDAVALVGSTGVSTGPHLHFEVRQENQHIDPWIWLP